MTMMKKKQNTQFSFVSSCRGFTLIEILITLALTGIVMSGVYAIYIANIRAVAVDEQRVEIQQGQRFAIDLMMRELRHAGYDLEEVDSPTIVQAGTDYIYFTADLRGCATEGCDSPANDSSNEPFPDGKLDDPGEHVIFCVYDNNLGYFTTDTAADINIAAIDTDDDGFADVGHTHGGLSHQAVSTIEALEFYYTLSDGSQSATPSADAGVDEDDIRSVEISLLSRAGREDFRFDNSRTFTTASGETWGAYNDGFRRMMMTTTVRFRNMGL